MVHYMKQHIITKNKYSIGIGEGDIDVISTTCNKQDYLGAQQLLAPGPSSRAHIHYS